MKKCPVIKPLGAPVTFEKCPVGFFEFDGSFALMSEYRDAAGQREAYCFESGELFWGGANTFDQRNALMVQPCEVAI